MIILGIDPGIATTGYGVIRKVASKAHSSKEKLVKSSFKSGLECLGYGLIQTKPCFATTERLKKIYNDLNRLIKQYNPELLAIENVYFFKNLKTVIPVSQAKGVILLTAAKKNIPVYEFTPLQIKKTIVNYGWAEKELIQKKIKSLLGLKDIPKPDDAADALAAAICCAWFLG